jgi:hypothetical protein
MVGLCAAGSARASWADGLFDELSRDFGSVPRGPTLQHPFRLVNKTDQYVTISGVRVSCGCVTAQALKATLAPGEETAVMAYMDTRRFVGSKNVTIYVTFSQPRFEEVRLWVQANSRDDVSVIPESLSYGSVKRGGSPAASVTISFIGNPNWQITGVKSDSNYVQPVLTQVRRDNAEVAYTLTTKLRNDTPPGRWYTDVWLTTNNPATPRVRIPLTVEVESALTVSPPSVALGSLKAGQQTERRVIVRGTTPFRITKVEGVDSSLVVRDSTDEAKTVHVLTVTLQPNQPGEVNRTLRVVTDLPQEGVIEFSARAQVLPK